MNQNGLYVIMFQIPKKRELVWRLFFIFFIYVYFLYISLLFDLFKADDKIDSCHKSYIFSLRKHVLSFMRAQHVLSIMVTMLINFQMSSI